MRCGESGVRLGIFGGLIIGCMLGGCRREDRAATSPPIQPVSKTDEATRSPVGATPEVGKGEGAGGAPLTVEPAPISQAWVVSPENEKAEGEAGYCIRHEDTGLELVYVPAGSFMMGCKADDPHANEDEKPAHRIRLSAYWIGRTEVTVSQWTRVMGQLDLPLNPGETWRNEPRSDQPVMAVNWDQSRRFCEELGLRLPTEAEWEFAARGAHGKAYPWGDEWDETKCCNGHNQPVGGGAFPVGSFQKGVSWCGALDMAGNAQEWCADLYDATYYACAPERDPTGPVDGYERVVRGRSCGHDDPRAFRSADRARFDPLYRDISAYCGFRCARDAEKGWPSRRGRASSR